MWVYIRTNKWSPWKNTVAYFPLTENFVDKITWDWPTSASWDISLVTKDWIKCAYGGGWTVEYLYNNRNWSTWNDVLTWHMWCNKSTYTHERQTIISTWYSTANRCKSMWFHYNQFWTWSRDNDTYHFDALLNQRALYTWTFDGSTTKAYLNWVLKNSKAMTYSVDSNNYSCLFSQCAQSGVNTTQSLEGYVSNIIMENKVWTAEEIAGYYNSTKSLYGING